MAFNKDKLAKKAQKYMRKGQLQKALELYRKIVDKYPSEMRYWKKIGDIQVKNGNKEGAIDTYLHISDEFIQKGFFKKAVAILRQIQSLDKNNEEVYDKLSTVYIKTNFIPDALHQLEQLQRIQKENNQQDKLIATLRKMADIDPSQVVHRIHLAETLSKMNNRREASAEFKKVADYLDKNNKTEDFIKVAERYLFHSPEDREYIKKLGHAYLEEKKPHKIVKRLLKIYQTDPADMDNLHLLARVFIALNNLPKAIKVYKEMARLLKEHGKTAESQAVLKKILELDPNDKATKKALGMLREQESSLNSQPDQPEIEEIEPDQIEEIEEDEEIEELELDDEDIEVLDEDDLIIVEEDVLDEDQKKLVEETEAFIKFGLLDKARENLTEIEEIDHYKVHEVKMKIMLKIGKKDEAMEIMESLLEKYPEDQENKKQDVIQKALEIEPECKWALEAKENLSTPSKAETDNMSTQQIAAILDFDDSLDDAFSMMDEIESAEQELSFSDYHPDFEDMENQLHTDEEVDEVLSQQEEQLYLDSDNPEEIEEDIEDMLTSLKGLNEEISKKSTPEDSQNNQVILDEIDELQALKDASQSFIRINELSKEQKIENVDSKFDFSNSKISDKQLELNEEVFEFDNNQEENAETPVVQPPIHSDDNAETPVVNIDPITHEIDSSSSSNDDEFDLDLEDTEFELDTIDSKSNDNSTTSEPEEEFSDQETMQKFDEMMEFSNKVSDEISVISSATKLETLEKSDQEIVQPETAKTPEPEEVEEKLPEEISDALEEIDFFISIESTEEAKRCFLEISEWHSHSTLQKYFELLDITKPPEVKQDLPDQSQTDQKSEDLDEETEDLDEETDKKEKIHASTEDLDEETPIEELHKFSEEDIQDLDIDLGPEASDKDNSATEDLSLDFSNEEESQIEQLDFNDNNESIPAIDQENSDAGMRIETEKPIGDASSHLDLGLAYKGMGLYKQALEELKYAMEDDQYETQARILAAKCKQAQGQPSEAANTLKYALHNQNIKEEEKLDVYYELGIIYNALEDKDEALYFFKKVARRNKSYRQVQNKIDELTDN
ncbi:MAG: tetratricopeptide repeat protein [Myxococcota bacterium]